MPDLLNGALACSMEQITTALPLHRDGQLPIIAAALPQPLMMTSSARPHRLLCKVFDRTMRRARMHLHLHVARRILATPPIIPRDDGVIILSMIGGVVLTELLAEAFESAAHGDQPGAFVSAALAVPLRAASSPEALQAGFAVLWWAHIVLVAAFLVYLPFSKHLHIATSFPNIWFRKLRPRGELPQMDLEDETATFGLKTLQDLGWKDLLDGFTCTECGLDDFAHRRLLM